jgi:endonuclease G
VTRVDANEDILWYRADTAHGSSGAPVFNNSLQLVALHSGGRIKRNQEGQFQLANRRFVDSVEGLTEADVAWEANVGTRVSRICEAALRLGRRDFPTKVALLEAAMAGGDVLAVAVGEAKGRRVAPVSGIQRELMADAPLDGAPPAGVASPAAAAREPGTLSVPFELRVSLAPLGQQLSAPAATSAIPMEREASRMRMPVIYDDLESRDGFLPGFLDLDDGLDVPMPMITESGQRMLAPLLDGSGTELRYKHFSVWMHRTRRLTLMSVSMVDWTARRETVDGKAIDRDTLNGFPKDSNIPELWAEDPRIASEYQLPDVFFTEDRGAFDKGHIVRRDDVCWGSSFEEIQMANGDTFHTTNCSPQTKPFNRGPHGRDNWGDLETQIQKATRKDGQKACIFAGPVFGRDDRWFHGVGEASFLRVQVPSRYWKIVVVKGEDGPEAYGFLLKQDVRAITEREFFVGSEWLDELQPLADIQKALRGWIDLDPLLQFDRYREVDVRG